MILCDGRRCKPCRQLADFFYQSTSAFDASSLRALCEEHSLPEDDILWKSVSFEEWLTLSVMEG